MIKREALLSEDGDTIFFKTIDNLFVSEDGSTWVVKIKDLEGWVKARIIAEIPENKNDTILYITNMMNCNPKDREYYEYMFEVYYPMS